MTLIRIKSILHKGIEILHYLCNMEVKNVYRQGADDGLLFGALLTAVSLCFIYSGTSAIVAFLAIMLLLMLPVVLFVMQRRYAVKMNGIIDVSSLWMLGLMISLCGSLICGAVTYMWLNFIEPAFIYDQVQGAIEVWRSVPEMQNDSFVNDMQIAIEKGLLPSAIEFVMNMILLTTFFGSMVSLLLAGIVRFLLKCENKK